MSLKEAIRNEPVLEKEEDHHQGTDLFQDIIRLDKLIKKQMINYKRSKTDEYKIKYANSIGLLTQKKVDISCIVLKVEEIIKGKTYYRPK